MLNYLINKKVTTVSIFILIVIMGAVSLNKLKIDLLPSISFPTLTVVTLYENASPSEIETLISKPLEDALSTLPGITKIKSDSLEGISIITLNFSWKSNLEYVLIQTREKVDLAKNSLPQDSKKSIVLKFDPNESAIMKIAIIPKKRNDKSLRFFIFKNILPYLERSEGVAAISMKGGFEREIQVEVEQDKLYSFGLNIDSIIQRVMQSNSNFPAGNIRSGEKEILIRTDGLYRDIDSIKSSIISTNDKGSYIKLSNIAKVSDSYKERTSISKLFDKECVSLDIKKEIGKNTVNVNNKLIDTIRELNEKFRDRIEIRVIEDQSIFIKSSILNVSTAGMIAVLLCFLILLFFYSNFKEPIIVILSVPLSTLLTLCFMYFNDLTLNTMSLGGLAIGVGMVIDSSSVVYESIRSNYNASISRKYSAILGTKEVTSSLISSTITSCIVFLPVLFVDGIAGVLFREFSLTISFSLLSSLIVSLSIIPVFSSFEFFNNISKIDTIERLNYRFIQSSTQILENGMLFFKNKFILTLAIILLTPLVIGLFFISSKKEMMPFLDQGSLTIDVETPDGSSLAYTEEITDLIVNELKKKNKFEYIFSSIGYDELDISLNPDPNFGLNKSKIFVKFNKSFKLKDFKKIYPTIINNSIPTSVRYEIIPTKTTLANLLNTSNKDIMYEISGTNSSKLEKISEKLLDFMTELNSFHQLELSSKKKIPVKKIVIDRDKLALFNLTIQDVASNINASIKGIKSTKYREKDNEFDILVRYSEKNRSSINFILDIPFFIEENKVIRLSSFAKIVDDTDPRKIFRKDGSKTIILSGNFKSNNNSDSGIDKLEKKINELNEDSEISILPNEEESDMIESFYSLGFTSLFALVLVYMVIASQFENLIEPFIIILIVVFTFLGALIFIFISGNSLNIISGMGIVLLIGLVVNNGIILIDFYKNTATDNYSSNEFLMLGIRKRLITIFNTTLTTIIGMMPAVLSIDEKSPQEPMAIAVIGGLLFSTVASLLFIPGLYFHLNRERFLKVSNIEKYPD